MTNTPDPLREALEAADALAEQAHHVALGASVPAMNIHGAASQLGPLWRKYHDTRAALAAAPQPLPVNRGHLVATITNAGNLLGWRGDTIADDLMGRFDITLRNAAAPQPAPADREALVEVIQKAAHHWSWARIPGDIADALLAAGWRRADQAALSVAMADALGNIGAMGFSNDPEVAGNIARMAVEMARKARAEYFAALPIQGGDDAA